MLTNIYLHGRLGLKFGDFYRMDVSSVAEAVRALTRVRPGLTQHLIESEKHGVGYHIKVGKRAVGEEELLTTYSPNDADIHIIPVPMVCGKKGLLQIVVGIVLIAVAVYTGGTGMTFFKAVAGGGLRGAAALLGASLVMQGVTSLIVGTPKFNALSGSSAEETTRSYLFNGSQQTSKQGGPVPVGYGKLHVGPQVISMGVSTDEEIGSFGVDSTPIEYLTGEMKYGAVDNTAGGNNPVLAGAELIPSQNGGQDWLGGVSVEGKPYIPVKGNDANLNESYLI